MILGKVIQSIRSTQKEPTLTGIGLLMIQPIGQGGANAGQPFVAADTFGCGKEQVVLVVFGKAARFAWMDKQVPVDARVVGLVDEEK